MKLSSYPALGILLAATLGLAAPTTFAASETPTSSSRTPQKAAAKSGQPAAGAQKTAAQKAPASKAASRSAGAPKTTAKKKASSSATANAAKTSAKPVRAASKPRRVVPAGEELVVAEGATCYQRTAGRGRCEPQCLPYTRCRSGIDSCRTGHENGPVTWFRCEQARGNTSSEPADGRVLVLGRNAHGMPTGHTLYVENAKPRGDGRYELTLSHTNYDRRCNLETNMLAEYDPSSQTIDVRSGKWEQWGRDLKVAGFIHN